MWESLDYRFKKTKKDQNLYPQTLTSALQLWPRRPLRIHLLRRSGLIPVRVSLLCSFKVSVLCGYRGLSDYTRAGIKGIKDSYEALIPKTLNP